MLQSFRPRFECRNRGKPLSCALSRLFSLAYSQGEAGRGEQIRQTQNPEGQRNIMCAPITAMSTVFINLTCYMPGPVLTWPTQT